MKRYVIQRRIHNWDPWEVCPGREYDTLEEVKAAFPGVDLLAGDDSLMDLEDRKSVV